MNLWNRLKLSHRSAILKQRKNFPNTVQEIIDVLNQKDFFTNLTYNHVLYIAQFTEIDIRCFPMIFGDKECSSCKGEGKFNVSDCCGTEPRSNGDSDTSDIGICAECGDHCEYGMNCEECKGEGVI